MKKFAFIFAFALAFVAACGPVTTPANHVEQNQVSSQQDIYTKAQPVHTYQFSAERAVLIQLYDLRVKGDLNTWSVVVSNSGVPLFSCPSKGFPIPYATELTNPQQVTTGGGSGYGYGVAVGQMDPNGLYPGSSLGTWVLCIDDKGAVHPQYFEPLVLTFTYPVAIKDGKIIVTGDSKTTLDIAQK